MKTSELFSQRLQELMKQQGVSQEELSHRTEIPIATIRAYLSGRRSTVSTRNLLLLAQVFELPMSEFVDYLYGLGNLYK